MGVPGNKHALKLTTQGERMHCFERFLEHLRQGYPKRSFSYSNGIVRVSGKSMDNYIKNYPLDFPYEQVEAAMAEGEQKWINRGIDMMLGKCEGKIYPALYQILMRNIYSWDKEKLDTKTVRTEAESLLRAWKGEIDELLDL